MQARELSRTSNHQAGPVSDLRARSILSRACRWLRPAPGSWFWRCS